jgi:hypothetical protein
MNLNEYIETLQDQLATAAGAAGEEARELATRLTAPLDSATRLVLLQALSAAADEITRELAPGIVEVRLRGGEPEFVVTPPPGEDEFEDIAAVEGPASITEEIEDGGTARLNLRIPETLKRRIEDAAGAEGVSLNAWLVRAATSALTMARRAPRRTSSGGDSFTGWVR